MRLLVVAASAVTLAVGCSAPAPHVAGEASSTSATPTPARPGTSAATTQSPTTGSLDPDLVFGSTPQFVWREHSGAGPGTVQNEDTSAQPGGYRLQLRCLGGSLGVSVSGRRVRDVECSVTPVSIPVCLRSRGLTVSAEWIRGPYTDLVWQVVRAPGSC